MIWIQGLAIALGEKTRVLTLHSGPKQHPFCPENGVLNAVLTA
ncbi:MAG: hypothetical protein ACRC8Y_10920 [Chroococcales cyanobacterium]